MDTKTKKNQPYTKKLLEVLRKGPYEIEAVADIENFLEKLRREPDEYRLVIFDEILAQNLVEFAVTVFAVVFKCFVNNIPT